MEDLNKNQIILLTLLVSFVTSIATGIITVSLLQQAPVEVTRNINNIVEKTIERVVPSNTLTSTTKEVTTVVVKEDDMIIESINKNLKSVVRVFERDAISDIVSFYGIGLVISKDGMIITSRKTITPTNIYTVKFYDGKQFTLAPIGIDGKTNSILFVANQTDKAKYDFIPAKFSSSEPQLGQTIISLGGSVTNSVSVGRIISLPIKESGVGTTTTKYISSIEADTSSNDVVLGSPLFDLSGYVIGMKLSDAYSKYFTPSLILKNEIDSLSQKE
jgi:S1-C subfamily serine protease